MTIVYTVEMGPNLYYANGSWLGVSTAKNINEARWFLDEISASRTAKRFGGKVLAYTLERVEERDSELDMLRSAVIELQHERDDAYAKINELLGSQEETE
jgi:hypothetical protein